jgi:hypothetical protein
VFLGRPKNQVQHPRQRHGRVIEGRDGVFDVSVRVNAFGQLQGNLRGLNGALEILQGAFEVIDVEGGSHGTHSRTRILT